MAGEATDEALMLRFAGGDAGAFETLYARHRAGLFRYLLRQCGNRAIADELFQDVWMKLIEARERYEPRARFATYLYTVAHHRLVDHYRRQGRLPRTYADDDPEPDALPAAPTTDPPRIANGLRQGERLLALLAELPEAQREAWLMREESGLSLAEIAEATGVGMETAKSRLRYATARLRRGMGMDA